LAKSAIEVVILALVAKLVDASAGVQFDLIAAQLLTVFSYKMWHFLFIGYLYPIPNFLLFQNWVENLKKILAIIRLSLLLIYFIRYPTGCSYF
jgi:hypothetical protein